MSEVVTLNRSEFDMLVNGLRTLARIPCPAHVNDDWPLMEAAGQLIRAGHVREARMVLESIEASQHSPAKAGDQ